MSRSTTMLISATGAYGKAVAEHSFAMLLMLQKKLNLYRDAQKKNEWSDFGTVTSITDATVLVVGLGDIGLHFARLASALGAHVIGLKRSMGPCPEGVHELHTMDELDELAAESGCCSFLCTVNSDYISYVHKRTIDGHEGHCHLLKQWKRRRSGFRSPCMKRFLRDGLPLRELM